MSLNPSPQTVERQNRMIQIILHQGFIDWRQLFELLSTDQGHEINPNVLNFDLHKLLEQKKIKRVGEGFKLADYNISDDGRIMFQ